MIKETRKSSVIFQDKGIFQSINMTPLNQLYKVENSNWS